MKNISTEMASIGCRCKISRERKLKIQIHFGEKMRLLNYIPTYRNAKTNCGDLSTNFIGLLEISSRIARIDII